jgi:hypothetical protein
MDDGLEPVANELIVTAGALDMSSYGLRIGHSAVIVDYIINSGRLVFRSWESVPNGSMKWTFYYSGTGIEYGYSSADYYSGAYGSWHVASGAELAYNTPGFSVVASGGKAFVAVENASTTNIAIRKGTFGSTDITFDSEQSVFSDVSSSNYPIVSYSMPEIEIGSDDHLVVAALRYEQGLYYQVNVRKSANHAADNEALTWQTQTAVGTRMASMGDDLTLTPDAMSHYMALFVGDESSNIMTYTSHDGLSWTSDNAGGEYAWFNFPCEDLDGNVYAVVVMGNDIYIGGSFLTAGGITVNRIAKYTPSTLTWAPLNTGTVGVSGGEVRALAVAGSGETAVLYVGGYFDKAGGITVNGIAKYTPGTPYGTWSALGEGTPGVYKVNNPGVRALAVVGTDLYAGGNFDKFGGSGGTTANNIARYNVSSGWAVLNTGTVGVNDVVYALATDGTNLYVGGAFTVAGDGVSAPYVAKYAPPTSTWSALGAGVNNAVMAMAYDGTGANLYVGGDFTTAGGNAASKIAKYSGSGWSALGSGVNGAVYALACSGSDLYVGGDFTGAGGIEYNNYIAKYSGSTWSTLNDTEHPENTGLNGGVRAIAVFPSNSLYVGGMFTKADSKIIEFVALYTVSTKEWSTLTPGNTGTNGTIYAMTFLGTDIYVGGKFTMAGGVLANNIAKFSGATWSALGSGADNTVFALAVDGSDLYVGGNFLTAGGVTVNRIAKYSGSTWSAMGQDTEKGVGGTIRALAMVGTDLYVGGSFSSFGGAVGNGLPGHAANNIARYDTTDNTFNTLGGTGNTGPYGVSGPVYAITATGPFPVIGGYFTTAYNSSGITVNNITRYNKTTNTFSALGDGLTGTLNSITPAVYALAYVESAPIPGNGILYAGGVFVKAGSTDAVCIAKYSMEGTEIAETWKAVGEQNHLGLDGIVRALDVVDSVLYVGGDFIHTKEADIELNRTATYTPNVEAPYGTWTALNAGSTVGVNGPVCALAVSSGNDVYVGGNFDEVKGLPTGHFAKYVMSTAHDAGSPTIAIFSDPETMTSHMMYWDVSQNTMTYKMFSWATRMWSPATTMGSGSFNTARLSLDAMNRLNAFWSGASGSYLAIGNIMPDGSFSWSTPEEWFI